MQYVEFSEASERLTSGWPVGDSEGKDFPRESPYKSLNGIVWSEARNCSLGQRVSITWLYVALNISLR